VACSYEPYWLTSHLAVIRSRSSVSWWGRCTALPHHRIRLAPKGFIISRNPQVEPFLGIYVRRTVPGDFTLILPLWWFVRLSRFSAVARPSAALTGLELPLRVHHPPRTAEARPVSHLRLRPARHAAALAPNAESRPGQLLDVITLRERLLKTVLHAIRDRPRDSTAYVLRLWRLSPAR